ncbi:MAG: tetratricopeptide repeat protein [Bacteroidota bacterium]
MKRYILSVVCCLLSVILFAQEEKENIRNGNKQYKEKKYSEAEKNYMEALKKKNDSYYGAFNLGDAYYKQKKYKEATEQFEILSARKTSKDTLAKVHHNLGNSYLQQKEFEKSINAYKNSLKNMPNDEETRYNLAYAQRMLKQQQQQKQDQKKEQDKNKDKNKKQDKKNQEEQQKQNISKEDAQRMMDALNNDEKKIRDKMNEQKVKAIKSQIEKDW